MADGRAASPNAKQSIAAKPKTKEDLFCLSGYVPHSIRHCDATALFTQLDIIVDGKIHEFAEIDEHTLLTFVRDAVLFDSVRKRLSLII